MQISYVYILKCADDSYYTGVTSNLDQRMQQHEQAFILTATQLQGDLWN